MAEQQINNEANALDVCVVDVGGLMENQTSKVWTEYNYDAGAGITALMRKKGSRPGGDMTYETLPVVS
eukprot:12369339-Karenia_brevis.AAC.1